LLVNAQHRPHDQAPIRAGGGVEVSQRLGEQGLDLHRGVGDRGLVEQVRHPGELRVSREADTEASSSA
jgi:hypothetical protein